MAGEILTIGPTDRNVEIWRGEHQFAFIKKAQTAVLVAHGGGVLEHVTVGVAGALAKFYDTPTGGTTDDSTLIATIDITTAFESGEISAAFDLGLTVVVTGANTEMTVAFTGAPTVNRRQFGTIDSNPGR